MRPDPHTRLIRAMADFAGGAIELVADAARPWRSVTFSGARHALAIALADDAAERLGRIDPAALHIPGHLLADLAIVSREPHGRGILLHLEALTIEDG